MMLSKYPTFIFICLLIVNYGNLNLISNKLMGWMILVIIKTVLRRVS